MPRKSFFVSVSLLALVALASILWAAQVTPKVTPRAEPFPLSNVRLLDSPFKAAMDRDGAYLLSLDADRLLSGFLENAGLKPKGKKYGGWEEQSLAGHSLGHHLSAVSLMYAASGDSRFKDRADYIVRELAACQKASDDGYLAAFEKGREMFAEVAKGDIRPRRFYLNGIWAPWYTMHKVFAGLRDAYQLAGNKESLAVMQRLGDWAIDTTKGLSEEQFQLMLETEHGGMNEMMADLFGLTGEQKYLTLAGRFNHKAVLQPLSKGVDDLTGLHGNTQIPKVIGAARQYELTGDPSMKDIAQFFWKTVIDHHTFAIGGHGDGEYFGVPGRLAPLLSNHTAETCNTYNMLKLTKHLFSWSPSEDYAAYYERALYNHILASQHPKTGMMCYFVPLRQGARKRFSTPENSFWCCVGTGMENHARYGESIYWRDAAGIYVNLFIASRLDWPEKGIRLRQETNFPQSASTKFVFENAQPVETELRIRKPAWVQEGFAVTVNGEPQRLPQEGSYVVVKRSWKSGDVVAVELPMALSEEAMPDDPNKVALFYGPVVLAGVLGDTPARTQPQADNDGDEPLGEDAITAPYFRPTGADVREWVKPVAGRPLHFQTQHAGTPRDVELVPLYEIADQTYSVYWDLTTPRLQELKAYEAEQEKKRLADLERRTVDFVNFGNEESEKDRNLQGETHRRGVFRGESWRQAERGWFSLDIKTLPSEPMDLVCRYWGGDGRYQSFDILVDGVKVVTEKLHHEAPGKFVDHAYSIPAELTKGKEKVTVRFQSDGNLVAGSVYSCRTTKLR